MKKQICIFTALLFAVSTLMVGCKAEVHTHTFAEEWSSDETNHWHAATCEHKDEVINFEEHSFGDWTITKEPTEEAEGSREKSCSVCEYTVPEVIEKLEHTHKFASEWTYDKTSHWHAATCGCSDVELQKTAHTFSDWITTKEATEEDEGSKERTCTVCGYKATEVIEKLAHTHKFATDWTKDETNHWHAATCGCSDVELQKTAHTFGEWKVTKEATCTEDGSKTGVCEVCKKEVTEKIDAKGHSYSGSWKKDASGHWKECVCGAKDEAEHNFSIWKVTTKPTDTTEGTSKRECEICNFEETKQIIPIPEGFVFVKGTTITGTESWTPESWVFVSGRKLTIPDLIVSDHEVTRGEYKAVMGSDHGNELEGDAVLNYPVNCVSWYDALVYCNKLSKAEGLTPCYSIDGSTDPKVWGTVPTSRDSAWDAVKCDWNTNGYRLPTEAEWEWLARGGQNYKYAGSDTVGKVAWYTGNTNDTGTRAVKTKAPNGYGLYDMSGNVWEWCWDWDWYGDSISSSTAADGVASGNTRVYCGGGWDSFSDECNVFSCCSNSPSVRHDDGLGFRVVRTAN